MVLTSLSKHTRKDFLIVISFGHWAFIASQLIFVFRSKETSTSKAEIYFAVKTKSKYENYKVKSFKF